MPATNPSCQLPGSLNVPPNCAVQNLSAADAAEAMANIPIARAGDAAVAKKYRLRRAQQRIMMRAPLITVSRTILRGQHIIVALWSQRKTWLPG
jgi:hypothetical protein